VTVAARPPHRAPRRRTQAERRAASERRLLLATAELVVERGLAGASMAEIGARAGTSHALVTHLFGSKAGLVERLNALVDEFYGERAGAAVAGLPGLDALVETARRYLALVTGPDVLGRVHVVLWAEAIAGSTEIQPSRVAWDRHFRDGIARVLTDGIADGSVRAGIDVAAVSVAIVGLVRGVSMQLLLDPAAADLATAQGVVGEAISALVRPAAPRTPRPRARGATIAPGTTTTTASTTATRTASGTRRSTRG
jgi:AcrR family transcriptional regulator